MSGSIDFIRDDPAADPLIRSLNAGMALRKARQDMGVDAAIRSGVSTMEDRGGSAYYQDPNAPDASGGAPLLDPSSLAPPPAAAPAAPPASAGATSDTTPPAPSAAPVPIMAPATTPSPRTMLESGGNPAAVNGGGYIGGDQWGTGLLADAGVYHPVPGENPNGNHWLGQIVLPQSGTMSPHDFLANPTAQAEARAMTDAYLARQIQAQGLDRFVGQNVNGRQLTMQDLVNEAHFAGIGGLTRYLNSGGAVNPSDGSTSSSAYIAAAAAGGGVPSPYMGAGMGGAPMGGASFFGNNPAANARYDPILSALAKTPGGGAPALQIMGQQSRYDMGMGRLGLSRENTLGRLSMQAFAHGDVRTGQYYWQMAHPGAPLPPWLGQDSANTRQLGTGALMAFRLFHDNPQAASVFTQTYLRTGDPQQALIAAGGAGSGNVVRIVQQGGADGMIHYLGVHRDGTAEDLLQGGVPLVGTRAPANTVVQTGTGPVVVDRNSPAPTAQPILAPGGGTVAPAPKNVVVQGTAGPAVVNVNGNGQPATPIMGPNNQPLGPRPLNNGIVAKVQALKAAGYDDATANAIAAGVKPATGITPAAIIAYKRARLSAMTLDPNPAVQNMNPAQREAAVDGEMDQTFGPGWRRLVQVAPTAQPTPIMAPPAAAAAPPPRSAPARAETPPAAAAGTPAPPPGAAVAPALPRGVPPGSMWSPSRRQWRDPAGRLYDMNGNPAPQA